MRWFWMGWLGVLVVLVLCFASGEVFWVFGLWVCFWETLIWCEEELGYNSKFNL